MKSQPLALPKNEEKHREEILDRVQEGWQEEEWAITMPQVINEILQKNLTTIRNPIVTRTSHATEGIQWIRIEELGKALTNRCRAVRELSNKKQKKQDGREGMWPSHKTQRKGWWCRAFAMAINRQCPTCNGLWTTKHYPPSLAQCLACSKTGAKKKPSQFKLQNDEVGLIQVSVGSL